MIRDEDGALLERQTHRSPRRVIGEKDGALRHWRAEQSVHIPLGGHGALHDVGRDLKAVEWNVPLVDAWVADCN